MRTVRSQINLFQQPGETINGFLVAKIYDLDVFSLTKLLMPFEAELREKGEFSFDQPTFNRNQFLLVLERLGAPNNLHVSTYK